MECGFKAEFVASLPGGAVYGFQGDSGFEDVAVISRDANDFGDGRVPANADNWFAIGTGRFKDQFAVGRARANLSSALVGQGGVTAQENLNEVCLGDFEGFLIAFERTVDYCQGDVQVLSVVHQLHLGA